MIQESPYKIIDDLGNELVVSKDQENEIRILERKDNQLTFLFNNKKYSAEIQELSEDGRNMKILLGHTPFSLSIQDGLDQLVDSMGMNTSVVEAEGDLTSPMPGLVLDVKVNEGDEVSAGDPIIILEAMKMENLLQAPISGTVKSVKVANGESVDKNQLLVIIE